MANTKCICTRIGCFFTVFGLVYFLESISSTYMISAVQSIEKQFSIPSKLSGSLVSAHDIGYIPTVVILSYLGSKGNRARWIGGGCMLMALGNLIISSPHFIFAQQPVHWNMTLVDRIIEPPISLKAANVTPKALFQYGPIRYKIPLIARHYLENKLEGKEPEFNISHLSHLSPELRKGFEQILNGDKTVEQFIFDLKNASLSIPSLEVKEKLMKTATAQSGFCDPIVNRLKESLNDQKCHDKNTNTPAVLMICFGLIFVGIGHSMPGTLGLPMMDDNIKRKSLPLYFGLMFFIKIMGPVSGFLIGSFTNKLYFTLTDPVGLTPKDPRWIGAWWLGFLLIAIILFGPSFALFMFPQGKSKDIITEDAADGPVAKDNRAPRNKSTGHELTLIDKHRMAKLKEEEEGKTGTCIEIKKFWVAILQILKCPIYTGALIGRMFDAFSFKGFFVFLPKYLDNHYGIPQYKANLFIGFIGVFGFATGMFIGSILMKKLNLEGRKAAAWVFTCSSLSLLMAFSKTFMGCHSVVNSIGQLGRESNFNFTQICNTDCYCDPVKLLPMCSQSGKVFFSPCQAGCRNMSITDLDETKMSFSDCSCVDVGDSVSREWCTDDCGFMIILYFSIGTIEGLIGGMGVIPGILIILRAVPPEHRSVAFGFSACIVSCGTWIAPIVYGFVIDSACLLWEQTCTGTGSCSIYEPSELRWRVHLLYCGLRVLGLTTDIWVVYWAKNLKIMEDEKTEEDETKNRENMSTLL